MEQRYLNRKSNGLEGGRREGGEGGRERAAVDESRASNHLLRWVARSRWVVDKGRCECLEVRDPCGHLPLRSERAGVK